MSEQFRIPKIPVSVEIRTKGGVVLTGSLFLGEGQKGQESVLELLNGDSRFLVVELESGEVTFLRLAGLSLVSLRDEDAFAAHGGLDPFAADLCSEVPLQIVFDDGNELAGIASYELPAERCRVQDLLNAPEPFFRFYHDDHLSFVNKWRVARATLR